YMYITAKFYNVFEPGDLRKWWSIAHFSYTNTNDPAKNGLKTLQALPTTETAKWVMRPGKYRREYEPLSSRLQGTNAPTQNATNNPLLRYSDILLMFAEAENAINGPTADAIAAVNQVRER